MGRIHNSPGIYYHEYSIIGDNKNIRQTERKKVVIEEEVVKEDVYTYKLKATPASITIEKNGTYQFRVLLQVFKNNIKTSETDVTSQCTWLSKNPENVIVNSSGLVTALKSGVKSNIVISYKHYVTNVVVYTQSIITHDIELTPSSVVLAKGSFQQFNVTLFTTKDGIRDEGVDVTNDCIWESSNSDISVYNGLVQSDKVGVNATITATYNNMTKTSTVEYTTITYNAFEISPKFIDLKLNQTMEIKAKYYTIVNNEISEEVDVTNNCTWVSDTNNISVTNGLVRINSLGNDGIITATYGEYSDTAKVRITSVITHELKITPTGGTINNNETKQFTATLYTYVDDVEDETVRLNVTTACTWISTHQSAPITNGLLTANAPGITTQVFCQYRGLTSNIVTLNVEDRISYRLEITPLTITLEKGQTKQLTAKVIKSVNGVETTYRSDVTSACTWESTNPEAISAIGGLVRANMSGANAQIRAWYLENDINTNLQSNVVNVSVNNIISNYLHIFPQELTLNKNVPQEIKCRFFTEINDVETYEDYTDKCIWEYDTSILKIENGEVVALKSGIGLTTIKATYGEYNDSINVRVNSVITYELKIENGSVIELDKDFVEPLTVKYYTITDDIKNEGINVTDICEFSISNNNVSIDEHGVVVANTPNTSASITATYNNLTDECNINIPEDGLKHMFIKVLEDDTIISFTLNTLEYSIDEGNSWLMLSPDNTTQSFNKGKVYFRFLASDTQKSKGIGTFSINKEFYVGGNILSLFSGDDMSEDGIQYTKYQHTFRNLFKECDMLLKVSKTFLPCNLVNGYGYYGMFEGCEKLINAPDLLSVNTHSQCYDNMFYNCISLIVPPLIKETSFSINCNNMFYGCESLTYVYDTVLKDGYQSFQGMFYGCTQLKDVSNIIIHNMGVLTCTSMFKNCSSLEISPSMIGERVSGGNGGGSALQMFRDCPNLRFIKFLAKTIAVDADGYNYNLAGWVTNVAPSGVFVKSKDAEWDIIGTNGVPEGWEIKYEDMEVASNNKEVMSVGDKFKITCLVNNINPSFENKDDITTACTFTSTNNSVNVDSYGIATITGTTDDGNCTITATCNGFTDTISLNIVNTQQKVSGYVKDTNGLPIQDAVVCVFGIENFITTDENGYYTIHKKYEILGQCSLIVIKSGYKDKIVQINEQENVNIILESEVCSETFTVNRTILNIEFKGSGYNDFFNVNVKNKTEEESLSEFSWIYTDNGNGLFDERFKQYFSYETYNTMGNCLVSHFYVTENNGRGRVGYLTLTHVGGWHATFMIVQGGIIQIEDIPGDAYKTVIPGKTPWIETYNQSQITCYNMGKAQKVLYIHGDSTYLPSAKLCIPGATDKTIYGYIITETSEYADSNIGTYLYDSSKGELGGDGDLKYAYFDLGVSNTYPSKSKHNTVVITFFVRNYDNIEGNYFAIPFRIVHFQKYITQKYFNNIVKKYGASNYDGTMNDLTPFAFPPLPIPDEVKVGYTHWLSTYDVVPNVNNWVNYGECNRVLYVTYEKEQYIHVRLNVICTKVYVYWPIFDSLMCTCEDGMDNDVTLWVSEKYSRKDEDNGVTDMTYIDFHFKTSSEFNGENGTNHRAIKMNIRPSLMVDNGKRGYFNIPFTIVQCKKNITKREFDDLVVKYGTSNYDGSMGKLDRFNF